MSYIGNPIYQSAFVTDQFNGTGSQTAYTMSVAPANPGSVLVVVEGVLQTPTTYSVSGTTLTFTGAPPAGTANISVRYMGIPASGVTTTAYRTVTEFTATAGQTTFTPPSYTVGFIAVYRNGVRLGASDYTASNGTTIVLASGASVNDLVITESFYVSSVLNAIPNTAGAVSSLNLQSGAARANWGAGGVLQVVSTTTGTTFSASSSTLTNTGISLSITPTSSTSKILARVIGGSLQSTAGNCQLWATIYRNSTNLSSSARGLMQAWASGASTGINAPLTMETLDSPATTSSTTYTIYTASNSNSYSVNSPDAVSLTFTLIEVAA